MTTAMRVAPLADLPDGRGLRLEVADHRIALFRVGTEVYAIGDRCSHAEASLSEGELYGYEVECPRHGSEFDIRTGEPGALPATRAVPVYTVSVIDGDVYLDIDPAGTAGSTVTAGPTDRASTTGEASA